MNKFLFKKNQEKYRTGFTMNIIDKKASIQDLLNELNLFIENGSLPRLWPSGAISCKGCHLCCHEPLPVTSIDVLNMCRALNVDFLQAYHYLSVHVQRNVVDIILKRKKGNCIFLNPQGLCRIYKHRPFLCQTYICCHSNTAFEETRSQIVNNGMDELVRMSLLAFRSAGRVMPVARGSMRRVRLQDWPLNQFTGRSGYHQIQLENVLSSALIKVLLV